MPPPTPEPTRRTPPFGMTVGYGLMVLGAIALFFVIRSQGERLQAPAVAAAPPAVEATARPDALFSVLAALAAVIIAGQLLAKAFSYLGQPPVIGEVVAGILLGPSLLGPELSARI